ncbi:MAG: hypothetical protein EPO55_00685 [Reyranella sp.]|uniref:hypothetical protein n=1 Tax=Reyranella sp. TaxID=1929291 RepID=UPI00121C2C49|nr:hypothetical protein [Reyranella sp.]TAJ42777.1 MAG: hypothetical protein EPO55_00685 [Reyranella sp.]
MSARRAGARRASRFYFWGFIGLLAGVVSAVVSFAWLGSHKPAPRLDSATLCPIDQPLAAHTILFIDTTDRLLPLHVDALRMAIVEERDALPVHGRFTLLFLAAGAPFEPEQMLSLCNPGDGRALNWLHEGQALAEKHWKKAFGAPIDAAVRRLANVPEANRSPILQGISAISRRADFSSRVGLRRLVVVSDLLQHDPGLYTHYQTGISWSAFTSGLLARQVPAILEGVSVRIEYLQRPQVTAFQGVEHVAFWRHWLRSAGADNIEINGAARSRQAGPQTLEARQHGPRAP